jgi:hypothetical protein
VEVVAVVQDVVGIDLNTLDRGGKGLLNLQPGHYIGHGETGRQSEGGFAFSLTG